MRSEIKFVTESCGARSLKVTHHASAEDLCDLSADVFSTKDVCSVVLSFGIKELTNHPGKSYSFKVVKLLCR